MPTYSISFRIQRTTVEYAYVSVPVTADVMILQEDGEVQLDEAGTARLDVDKAVQKAVELGEAPELRWHLEKQNIQMHPIQKAPEPDEQ